jgi:hypothetical protein
MAGIMPDRRAFRPAVAPPDGVDRDDLSMSTAKYRHGVLGAARERWLSLQDWLFLIGGRYWTLFMGTVLSLVGLLAIGLDALGAKGVAAVLAIAALVPMAIDLTRLRADLRGVMPTDQVVPDPMESFERFGAGRLARDNAVDEAAPWEHTQVSDELPGFVLRGDLAIAKPAVVAWFRNNRPRGAPAPFNGPCVRLATDLSADTSVVALQTVGYFDLIASNYVAGRRWFAGDGTRVVLDVNARVVDPERHLVPLAESDLANTVGVSTICLTEDGWMVIVVQGAGALSSARLAAPSSSGGLEPGDLVHGRTFARALAAGMERELLEEHGLLRARPPRMSTRVLGHGRWIEKGGKPEFFGVTKLHAALGDLDIRVDLAERGYVLGHRPIRPTEVARMLEGGPLREICGGEPSLPLEACVARLRTFAATPEGAEWLSC